MAEYSWGTAAGGSGGTLQGAPLNVNFSTQNPYVVPANKQFVGTITLAQHSSNACYIDVNGQRLIQLTTTVTTYLPNFVAKAGDIIKTEQNAEACLVGFLQEMA